MIVNHESRVRKILPIFTLIVWLFFNYLLTNLPCHNRYLSPLAEYGVAAAAALMVRSKINKDVSTRWRIMFSHFTWKLWFNLFQLITYTCPAPLLISQHPNWICQYHGCLSTANNNNQQGQCVWMVRKKYFQFFTLI